MITGTYQIKLDHFEGPFDLLLFFVERDELDIYDIPIHKIINDFLAFIHAQETLNVALSSDFILFVSTLMRIKSKMLLPRKELDAAGNEIDPRQELVDKLLEYRKFKNAAASFSEMEAERIKRIARGNRFREISTIGEAMAEGTEIQSLTLFRLMKSYEKVLLRLKGKNMHPVHTVIKYNYTMEESRTYIGNLIHRKQTVNFHDVFGICNDRIHALFLFLSLLEMIQQKFFKIIVGEGLNNFMIDWNQNRVEDLKASGLDSEAIEAETHPYDFKSSLFDEAEK